MMAGNSLKIDENDKAGVPACNRLLWLTDTYSDHNGVSMVLRSVLEEIKKRNLPIDILVSSNRIEPDDHLVIVKPVSEFNFPFYRQQPIRIPNYLEIRRIFINGRYDRIICSTEGPMGLAAIYLKKMFSVPAFFYLHTDWIMFAKAVMKMQQRGLNNVERLLSFYYNRYDGLFVLNTEQQFWLSGERMNMDPSRIFLTAHWVDECFYPRVDHRAELFGVNQETPVLLFAGRLSEEKGIMELPGLFQMAKKTIPGLTMIIAGTGPAESQLRALLPDAVFLGWVDHEKLPDIYSSSDMLVLPSQFDTFSCVVLEAISCGLPVIAYETKGPKDIVEDKVSGFLVKNKEEMVHFVVQYFLDEKPRDAMKQSALARSASYEAEAILNRLISNIGMRNAG